MPIVAPRNCLSAARALVVAAALGGLLCTACERDAATGSSVAVPPAAEAPPRLGLWVLAEGSQRVLEDPKRVERLVADARALHATDLFVQVYRGGRAWYDATRADPEPYLALKAATGTDTLALLLEQAHRADLRVHAWVNVLSLSRQQDAPLLRELGPEAVQVDQHGRSLLDYPKLEVPEPDRAWYRMGTRGIYLDPAAPGVAGRLAGTFAELVQRYPSLDGLHLDYIRHPDVLPFVPGSRFGVGLRFGHGPRSRERFLLETGLDAPQPGRLRNANRWDRWQREKLTELVALIRDEAQAARPGLLISAAVIAYVDRAYLSLAQDWRRWLEDGLLDFAVPMAYTLDDRLLRYQATRFARDPLAAKIWVGIGSWLFEKRPERARVQREIVDRAGVAAVALFSYDALADSPLLFAAMSGETPRAE